jgi:hypothetical protein
MDESIKNFLKRVNAGKYLGRRARMRLMERELNRLQKKNDARTSDGVDGEVPRRDES